MSLNKGPLRRIYPSTGALVFDGGLNTKYERSLLPDNESPDCANVIFNNGAVETREGVSRYNTAAAGSFVGDGMYVRRERGGGETMVAAFGGSLWTLDGTSFVTIGSGQSLFTAGVRFGAVNEENYLFLGNGGQIPYKWSGSTLTRHGVYAPTSANIGATAVATVASNGAGNLTSATTYIYKFTFRNANLVESDVGEPTVGFVTSGTGGQQNRLTSIPVAPTSFGVATRRIYRTASGSAGTFNLITTLNDNTTTTYDDNTADASVGAAAPTDQGVPPKWSVAVFHPGLGRIFMNDTANPGYVWWTEAGNPYVVKATSFKLTGDNSGDTVKGFGILNNSLYVFGDQGITIGYFSDNTDTNWKWIQSKIPYGCRSPYAVVNVEDSLMFPAVQAGRLVGFAQITGDALAPSASLLTVTTAGSDMKSDRIEPDVFDVQTTYLPNMTAVVHKNQVFWGLTYGSGNTTNNRVYLMDFSIENLAKNQREAWAPWTGSHMIPAQFAVLGGVLYYQAATAIGFAYKAENGTYTDNGTAAIDSYFWTKEFAGFKNEENFTKDFRYCNFLYEKAGDYFMNLTYRVDSDSGGGDTVAIDLNPGGSLWGSMVWGRDSWGGGRAQDEIRQFLGTARGKRIQFKFSNQNVAGQKFKLYRANYAYNLKGFR